MKKGALIVSVAITSAANGIDAWCSDDQGMCPQNASGALRDRPNSITLCLYSGRYGGWIIATMDGSSSRDIAFTKAVNFNHGFFKSLQVPFNKCPKNAIDTIRGPDCINKQ